MSVSQERVLRALGSRSLSTVAVAQLVDGRVSAVQRTLDALYRRSLVTITPQQRWCATERGRRRVAA